jgi:RNA polymerase sigma-70 factor (ECF subfamily)
MLNFQSLYNAYASEVYRFAYWLSGSSIEAEDVTSETFIRAWTKYTSIRTETLKAYLFTIARNVFLTRLRKGHRQVILEDIYPDPAPGPDAIVASQIELERIRGVLQEIPEIDRAAFILRVQNKLPYAEIARVLGLSLSASKVKVHRIRKKLLAYRLTEEEK